MYISIYIQVRDKSFDSLLLNLLKKKFNLFHNFIYEIAFLESDFNVEFYFYYIIIFGFVINYRYTYINNEIIRNPKRRDPTYRKLVNVSCLLLTFSLLFDLSVESQSR